LCFINSSVLICVGKKEKGKGMQTEITPRADLWVLAVALYKTSLSSVDDVSRWDRHAALFASHELENEKFINR